MLWTKRLCLPAALCLLLCLGSCRGGETAEKETGAVADPRTEVTTASAHEGLEDNGETTTPHGLIVDGTGTDDEMMWEDGSIAPADSADPSDTTDTDSSESTAAPAEPSSESGLAAEADSSREFGDFVMAP